MDTSKIKSSLRKRILPYLFLASIFVLALTFVLGGLGKAGEASAAEGLRIAEESIRRAVINCYASEGIYPPNYEYLKTHYGISIDEERYIVHYEIFASNIMPSITVLEDKGK